MRRAPVLTLMVLVAAIWGGTLASLHLYGDATVLDRLESVALDLRYLVRGVRPPPDSVAILAIDDETVAAAGAFPLPRRTVAEIVRRATDAGAAAVAVDLLFLDPGDPADDAALAAVLKETSSVVAAAAVFGAPAASGTPATAAEDGVPNAVEIAWPIAPIRGATTSGLVNIALEASGMVRHAPLIVRTPEGLVPGFALAAAATARGAEPRFAGDRVFVGPVSQALDLGSHLAIDFYGPTGTVRTIPAARLLAGDVGPAALRGRIVLVGVTALGGGDFLSTPYDDNLPGVEVLATAVANLIGGDGLVRDDAVRRIDTAVTVGLPVLVILLMAIGRPLLGTLLGGAAVLAWLAAVFMAFSDGLWLNVAGPLAAVIPPAIVYGAWRTTVETRRAARHARQTAALMRLQSPLLAGRLAEDDGFLARPVECTVAVLFLDLSGFTHLSETLSSDDTHAFLSDFHSLVAGEAETAAGFVAAFMGDGSMIVFGFPTAAEDDAERALSTTLRLARMLEVWFSGRRELAGQPMTVRFGLHYGPATISRLGPRTHQHVTATGDTVNVASRLLDLAKARKAALVVSCALLEALPDEARAAVEPGLSAIESVHVKNRDGDVAVRVMTSLMDADAPAAT